tara:strand:- start:1003 stop:1317 length:315 start_codon:yes stop_codon:yes gene_type:complete
MMKVSRDNEWIKAADIRRSDGVDAVGKCHADIIRDSPKGTCKAGSIQGFITNTGRLVKRKVANRIAFEAGQIKKYIPDHELLSEEIWSDNDYYYDEEKGYVKNE